MCSMDPADKCEWQDGEDCWMEVEATIDSGAATCVFPQGLFDAPVRPCQESENNMSFRTASGERVRHQGLQTIEALDAKYRKRRLTAAVTRVSKVLLAVSRLPATGHEVRFTPTGGFIENKKDGIRIPMEMKNGVYIIKLWIRKKARSNECDDSATLEMLFGGQRQAETLYGR